MAIPAEQHFRQFADSIPHILWTAEPDGTVDYVNQTYTDYAGVTLDVASQSWVSALHPDDVDRVLAAWNVATTTGNEYFIEFRIFHLGTGAYRWNSVTAKPVRDETARIVKWYGIATDVHERKLADEKANLLANRLNSTIENMSDCFIMLDQTWRVSYINRVAERTLQRPKSDLLGKVIWNEITVPVENKLFQECRRAAAEKCAIEFEYPSPLSDFWYEIRIYPSEGGVSVYWRDITKRKTAEKEIQRLAFHDQLTGLPNRQLLRDRLQHAVLLSKRSHSLGAVMFIDLDNFKTLNDTQGHHKGDLLLQQLAQRLTDCAREIDTVARLGGDEFVVVLEELSSDAVEAATQAELIGEKILAALSQPCELVGYQHIGTASIGITLLDSQTSSIDELLKRADLAMYRAKAAGRNVIRFFDPAMQTAINAKMALETGLRESIQNNMFVLHYQPQLDNESRIIGVEALLRWSHPEYKNVPPSEFIPTAEETGLILPLGRWVLETACSQLVEWAKEAHTARLTLSVNVSAHQFRRPDFVREVLDVVRESGANPERLKLELTETVLINDIEDAVTKITVLKNYGITFALDDFGTGYSSLSYLRHLPLEQLKIDRSFIGRIPGNVNDAAIVQAIIGMGHTLGLTIIAEGVETEQQLRFLAEHGCNAYQGFLFSKAVTAEEFGKYLSSNEKLQAPTHPNPAG
jgi:diguanylate cyclase (GGDEF)-like protein/PAS domain S-box-containing protein